MSSQNPGVVEGEVVSPPAALATVAKTNARVALGQGVMFQSMAEVFSVANAIQKSGAGPAKATPGMIATAILKGQALGLDPVTSWCNIAVVNGRATIMGDVALGVVRRSGLLGSYTREWIGTEGQDDYGCKVTMQRKDTNETISYSFTFGEAKKAKLLRTDIWTAWTKRMVYYRALSFVLRDLFSDVLNGTYLREEFEAEPGTPTQQEAVSGPLDAEPAADPLFEAAAQEPAQAEAEPASTERLPDSRGPDVEVALAVTVPPVVAVVEAVPIADPFEAAAEQLLKAVEAGVVIPDDKAVPTPAAPVVKPLDIFGNEKSDPRLPDDPFQGFRDPEPAPPKAAPAKKGSKKPPVFS